MFASQWFLTLFTARFPLYFVFHILDVFLLQGVSTLFQIALALLTFCRKDLLTLDFEGVLKYFRVSLPKKCRTEEVAKNLIKLACGIKLKKLKKYEAEFLALKAAQDTEEQYSTEMDNLKSAALRNDEEKRMLIDELTQVKDMLVKSEIENKRSAAIICEYKQICKRQDEQHSNTKLQLDELKNKIQGCTNCDPSNTIPDEILNNSSKTINHPLEQLSGDNKTQSIQGTLERVRELELELAQTKLAHVEAECRNQDLTHQLHATLAEIQNSRNNWPPWLSKTLTSIKEQVATKRDIPTFQSYTQSNTSHHDNNKSNTLSNLNSRFGVDYNSEKTVAKNVSVAHNSLARRESLPQRKFSYNFHRNSCEIKPDQQMSVLKDSVSCTNLSTK